MDESARWTILEMECPEEQRRANLLLGWVRGEEEFILNSIYCDNCRLKETDNWDCNWSCIEGIVSEEHL